MDGTSVDFASILKDLPIDPCGEDMQYHNEFDAIRRARQQDERFGVAQGIWEKERRESNWPWVIQECESLLIYKTKDIQVAAWLFEALMRSRGVLAGVQGLHLFVDLTMQFWEGVYPRPEDGDMQRRLQPINWMIREFLNFFRTQAEVFKIAELTPEEGRSVFEEMYTYLQKLSGFLTEKTGDEAPVFRELLEAVSEFSRVHFFTGGPAPKDGNPGKEEEQSTALLAHQVGSRDMAYEQLKSIAVYLAKVEPHSPVPTILNAVLSWKNFRFEDLLEKLPSDTGTSVYDMLRIFRYESTKIKPNYEST